MAVAGADHARRRTAGGLVSFGSGLLSWFKCRRHRVHFLLWLIPLWFGLLAAIPYVQPLYSNQLATSSAAARVRNLLAGKHVSMEQEAARNKRLSWAEYARRQGVNWESSQIEWLKDTDLQNSHPEASFLFDVQGHSLRPSKILPYYYRASQTPSAKDLSVQTLMTSDRVTTFADLVERYRGPISVTVHINDDDDVAGRTEFLRALHDLYVNSPYMSTFVDLHLVVDKFDRQFNLWRNVAKHFARTDYVFMLDVDLYMCTDLRKTILEDPSLLEALEKGDTAFVIPAFWYVKRQEGTDPSVFPTNKSDLVKLVKENKIEQFHKKFAYGHGSTNTSHFLTSDEGYKIESYHNQYEPYLVSNRKKTPYCDERFIGFGANKIACIYEMYISGVSLQVLPNDFIIHKGHIYPEQIRLSESIYNGQLYRDQFTAELCFRYLKQFHQRVDLFNPVAMNMLDTCAKVRGFRDALAQARELPYREDIE